MKITSIRPYQPISQVRRENIQQPKLNQPIEPQKSEQVQFKGKFIDFLKRNFWSEWVITDKDMDGYMQNGGSGMILSLIHGKQITSEELQKAVDRNREKLMDGDIEFYDSLIEEYKKP